ncbi:unnamed protein product, partial [Rotaria sp. Silwood2]
FIKPSSQLSLNNSLINNHRISIRQSMIYLFLLHHPSNINRDQSIEYSDI